MVILNNMFFIRNMTLYKSLPVFFHKHYAKTGRTNYFCVINVCLRYVDMLIRKGYEFSVRLLSNVVHQITNFDRQQNKIDVQYIIIRSLTNKFKCVYQVINAHQPV